MPDSVQTPCDIFLRLLSPELLETLVTQTNLYCSQSKKEFTPTTVEEMKIFIAINILTGIKKLPSYRDYWSSNSMLRDPYISSLMTVKRFSWFLTNLHLTDNSLEPKPNDPNSDKLYKLRPLLDTLNRNFKENFDPGQHQAVDETMIKFTERSTVIQYSPIKPIKRGYKAWVRADSSGYVCKFEIYTGKKGNSPETNLGPRVVKDLTEELTGKNHQVYFDNFFTSVPLMIELRRKNIFACGTVRKKRRGLPVSTIDDKKMKRGDVECCSSNKGVSWVKWKDTKAVQFLSNFHDISSMTVTQRKNKKGERCDVSCPEVAKDYNKHMGYVDKADMLKSIYEIDRKSKMWWPRIFWHFIDVTVTNSFIIHKIRKNEDTAELKGFRLLLVDGLVKSAQPTSKGRSAQLKQVSHYKKTVPEETRFNQVKHMPEYGNRNRCAYCSTKTQVQRSPWSCKTCEVSLCLNNDRNCFSLYHQKANVN